jgi:hypothetical protein
MTRYIGGFLLQCLKLRDFNEAWCSCLEGVLMNGTMPVKMNGITGPYFQSYIGIRQGDPLSALLFNIVVDCLTRMVVKAQQKKYYP